MRQAGERLASGRDSDIFECGDGLVLRRSRAGTSMAVEARTMEYARGHGFPVPAVHEVSEDGTELVMERIDGTTMLAVLGRQPWTIPGQGAVLAELHERLHEIPAPDSIAARRAGRATGWSTWTFTRSTSWSPRTDPWSSTGPTPPVGTATPTWP